MKAPRENSKPRQSAVALEYGASNVLPTVLASGVGQLAQRIIELAEQHGIPIHQDGVLAEMLSGLPSGSSVTPESHRLVAEVISFLYYCDKEWRAEHPFLGSVL